MNNTERILSQLKLRDRKSSLVGDLSGGLKQRLAIACAMVHEPEIIFLDEPTAGVDPVSRKEIWEILKQLSHDGVTLFLTTHYMEEAEKCHTIGFLFNGILTAVDTPQHFKNQGRSLEEIYISFMRNS